MNIVITGGSKGLGRAFAEAFAAGGHHLALCSRSEEELQATAQAIRKQFPEVRVEVKAFDLSSKGGAEGYAAWVRSRFEVVDILINNAGRFLGGNIYDEPEGTLEAMINTNLYSAYHLTRALLPVMMAQKGDRYSIFVPLQGSRLILMEGPTASANLPCWAFPGT